MSIQDSDIIDGDAPERCDDCGCEFASAVKFTTCDDGNEVCEDCYEKRSYFSNCCGYEANGIDLDYQICGDCHDHCEYSK